MVLPENLIYNINGQVFEVIKATRLNEGMVFNFFYGCSNFTIIKHDSFTYFDF